MLSDRTADESHTRSSPYEIFLIFLRLGVTCFGGPVAHLGFFRQAFVDRRQWLNDRTFADLVALCQFLPGPASSEVGIAIGLFRGGVPGALAAWAGFTLPSALALTLFGLALNGMGESANGAWLHGLKVAAVAVVAQALWGMGKTLCPDAIRASIAVAAALFSYLVPGALGQLGVIVGGGLLGWAVLAPLNETPHRPLPVRYGKSAGVAALAICAVLLAILPYAAEQSGNPVLRLFDGFYRSGALVFGGGHVVLPMLQAQVVPSGLVSNDAFLAGYGAAQAVPGPLFTFAAYLGAVSTQSPNGWVGSAIALVAIFLPAFLLVIGALPLWEDARRLPAMQRSMLGVNAAVVGMLLAAFHHPVWSSAILSTADFLLAVTALQLLMFWKTPPWLVVAVCACAAGLGWS